MYRLSSLLFVAAATSWLLFGSPARAGDPLDDVSGTEEWDQVVPPARDTASEPVPRDDFRQQVEDWNNVRVLWQDERESFVQERTRLGRVMPPQKPAAGLKSRAPAPQPEEDWGDQPADSWSPSAAIDRAIDEELGEAKPAPATKAPAPVTAVPAPALPAAESPAEQLSSFRGARDVAVPTSEPPAAPPPALPPPEADFPPPQPAPATAAPRNTDDEAAGAAAAAALLKQLEEERRKEQEALRKKAQLEEDEEGQIVDPELKKEISDDQEP